MPDLPDPWSTYHRLQTILARKSRVDEAAWGFEAGLNRPLFSNADPEAIERAVRSERRKERHRARLRRIHLPAGEPTAISHETAVSARERLRRIQTRVNAEDWSLLRAVAHGRSYQAIASARGAQPGALRIRVLRLRRALSVY